MTPEEGRQCFEERARKRFGSGAARRLADLGVRPLCQDGATVLGAAASAITRSGE